MNKDIVAKIDKLFSEWEGKATPGFAIGILRRGKILYSRGYGMASLEHGVHNGRQERIEDPALATSVEATAYPNGQQKLWGLIVGGAELIDAATNDAAWNAVGDAVSAITEAATSNNYNDPNDTSDHNCVSQGTC